MASQRRKTLEDLVFQLEFLVSHQTVGREDEIAELNATIDRRLDMTYNAVKRVVAEQHLVSVVSTVYHVMIQRLQYQGEEPVVKPDRDPGRIITSRLGNYARIGLNSREMMEEWAEDVSDLPWLDPDNDTGS